MIWIDIVIQAASDTFIQVGSFVGITLLTFGLFNYITYGKLINKFKEHKKLQVLFGALLGLTPGCGGAILVMPLYLKGHATFGTIVATLISTMGDAAFILLVRDPISLFWVVLISFIVGLIVGYSIDYFKIRVINHTYTEEDLVNSDLIFQSEQTILVTESKKDPITNIVYFFRHHIAYIIFWLILLLSFPLGIMNLMQIDFNTEFSIKNLGIIGAVGTFFSIFYSLLSKKYVSDDTLCEIKSKQNSLKETLIHNAEETAFVVMWVFVALFFYESFIYLIGGEEILATWFKQTGYISVLVALLVGLIPGCGPHIILATMYVNGLIPFSALIANAICNDGDALFPILAMDTKSAIWVTLWGLIPAFIVGTGLFLLGF